MDREYIETLRGAVVEGDRELEQYLRKNSLYATECELASSCQHWILSDFWINT